MKTYFSHGIVKDIPYIIDNPEEFQIQDLGSNYPDRYIYPNDSIKYELDNELVSLYDTLQFLYFEDNDNYYNDIYSLPIWVQSAGQNSDFNIDANHFLQLISNKNNILIPDLFKHLYLVDCQFLVGTIQNLLSSMEDAFIKYYITLSKLNIDDAPFHSLNDIIWNSSETSRCTASLLETYFTKAYSVLDIICKIYYELQNPNDNFSSYKKIKSAKILWGDRHRLEINDTKDTLFEQCDFIRVIESLRNEAVHNGTWELNPKIYIQFKNGLIKERFMLFPDMKDGRLTTIKNRKHFFSKNTKVNNIFPMIHLEFKKRLLNTIRLLNNKQK